MIQKVADLGIAMSQPLDFGTYGENVYQFLSWVEGVEAEEALLLLNKKEQYQLGVKTGEFLRKIHSIPAPSTIEDWETRFNRKVDNKIENYRECEIRFSGEEEIISYIEKNRKLLSNRPQCLQHGDYHVGNMIISRKNYNSLTGIALTLAIRGRSLTASYGVAVSPLLCYRASYMDISEENHQSNPSNCLLSISPPTP